MSVPSLRIVRQKGWVKVKLGVNAAALVPVKHIHSYKLPHHENKNYKTFLGNLQDAWSGRYIS
jgi:hypothetical protein